MVEIVEKAIGDVTLLKLQRFEDERGCFLESWNFDNYSKLGLSMKFVQSNVSYSNKNVLRGLHFQNPNPQGKLVYVLAGEVFDVAVDIRIGSPTFGQWYGQTLTAENGLQLYIPEGYAHGFCVLSGAATFCYLCTANYDPVADGSIVWNDPVANIKWPINQPLLSTKDANAPSLDTIKPEKLPVY